jgi:uncharacterized protein YidB (DUF937 family)
MDIAKMGAEILQQKLGLSGDLGGIVQALVTLLGGKGGKLDLGSLVSSMQSNPQLLSLVGSWLGDGANNAISPAKILDMLGDKKISAFASSLGITAGQATEGLSEAIPAMIDKASSGGKLADSFGGAGAVFGALKSFL